MKIFRESDVRIGIDVGISGAIAYLDENTCQVFDMPTMPLGKNRQQVNAAALYKILASLLPPTVHTPPTSYLERVSSRPGQGVSSMFNFGVSYGVVQGVLASLEIPMVLVNPAVWKRRAGLIGKDKDAARTLAQQLYPRAELSLKKHVGRADALLIALFGAEYAIHSG